MKKNEDTTIYEILKMKDSKNLKFMGSDELTPKDLVFYQLYLHPKGIDMIRLKCLCIICGTAFGWNPKRPHGKEKYPIFMKSVCFTKDDDRLIGYLLRKEKRERNEKLYSKSRFRCSIRNFRKYQPLNYLPI